MRALSAKVCPAVAKATRGYAVGRAMRTKKLTRNLPTAACAQRTQRAGSRAEVVFDESRRIDEARIIHELYT